MQKESRGFVEMGDLGAQIHLAVFVVPAAQAEELQTRRWCGLSEAEALGTGSMVVWMVGGMKLVDMILSWAPLW